MLTPPYLLQRLWDFECIRSSSLLPHLGYCCGTCSSLVWFLWPWEPLWGVGCIHSSSVHPNVGGYGDFECIRSSSLPRLGGFGGIYSTMVRVSRTSSVFTLRLFIQISADFSRIRLNVVITPSGLFTLPLFIQAWAASLQFFWCGSSA